MKKSAIIIFMVFAMIASAYGQKPTLELTFTAVDSASYVQLDSIKVMNITQGGDTVLYWPDTTLVLGINAGDTLLYIGYSTFYPVGVHEIKQNKENFQVLQNYPNPVKDQTIVSLYIPEKGTVSIMVTDMPGREVINGKWLLNKGYHSFSFSPGNGNLFFLTAQWNNINRSIKILTVEANSGNAGSLEYIGSDNSELKSKPSLVLQGFVQESGILDAPFISQTFIFQFATNIPCLGTPTVTYEGQVYNTIQIFSQCWLKENLNVGIMIQGSQDMTNNGIIEKYCYGNNFQNCFTYGGLYQWNEMMQYTTTQGTQGICPPGWHLPADEEWKVLEGAVDSQYGIGDIIWDENHYRGFDAGLHLKTSSGWNGNGNGTDLFGFSGLPGGGRYVPFGWFLNIGKFAYLWSSTEGSYDGAWLHHLDYDHTEVYRDNYYKEDGRSVRCVRDN